MRWGIKAVVAESFAEIFFGNCCSLGIAAVRAERSDLEKLAQIIEDGPANELTVDLETLTVSAGDVSVSVTMPDSARNALITGEWDYLGQLLSAADQVQAHEASVPYLQGWN